MKAPDDDDDKVSDAYSAEDTSLSGRSIVQSL